MNALARAIARGTVLRPEDGGHDYQRRGTLQVWECRCGAWLGAWQSRGPTPFGRCPMKPNDVAVAMERRG